jgi:hypothetical protein
MKEQVLRKTILFPESLWEEAEDFRFLARIKSDTEVVRTLMQAGLYLMKLREDPLYVKDEEAAVERLNAQG